MRQSLQTTTGQRLRERERRIRKKLKPIINMRKKAQSRRARRGSVGFTRDSLFGGF